MNEAEPNDQVILDGSDSERVGVGGRRLVAPWSPISTAPKDERILVTHIPYTGRRVPVRIAWFSTARLRKHKRPWMVSKKEKLAWHPTDWMPLPYVPSP